MTQHVLKTLPKFFEATLAKRKTFELRENDRNFQVGDILTLQEFTPGVEGSHPEHYTGRFVYAEVTYVLDPNDFRGVTPEPVLNPKYVGLGLKFLD